MARRSSFSSAKPDRRLSALVKEDDKAEGKTLTVAMAELASLHKLQKQALKVSLNVLPEANSLTDDIQHKHEHQAQNTHSKSLGSHQKVDAAFLALRTRHEASAARLKDLARALEESQRKAKEANERVLAKTREVERLRAMDGVEHAKGALRLIDLGRIKPKSLWRK